MKKKHIRNFLIAVCSIAGIVYSTQVDAKTCYNFQGKTGRNVAIGDISDVISVGGTMTCRHSDKMSSLGVCKDHWYGAAHLKLRGVSSERLKKCYDYDII